MIVYSPMGSGMLTGAMTRERIAALPDDDWRKHDPRFNEPQLSRNLELVERLRAVAERHDTVPGAVAIAWTLRNPAVDGAIVGFRSPEQVDPMIDAANLELSRRRHHHDRRSAVAMQTIGFIGLGKMGGNMAARYLAAGYTVYGEARNRNARPVADRPGPALGRHAARGRARRPTS